DVLALVSIKPDVPPRKFTYGDYFRRAAGYANFFHENGLKSGEVVILILPPGPKVMFAFWGAMLIGAIPSIFPTPTEKLDVEHYGNMVCSMANTSAPAMMATYAAF